MKSTIDPKEFENQTFPHRDALLRTAVRMCGGDSDAAEDMVQDTYLKAYLNFHRFKPGTNLRAWLFRILANRVISAIRHQRIAREAPYPEGFEPLDEGPAIESNFDADRIGDELKHALDDLPESYRDVFLHAALDDSTYEEIARKLGLPVGTVMSRLWRARQQLKRMLEGKLEPVLN